MGKKCPGCGESFTGFQRLCIVCRHRPFTPDEIERGVPDKPGMANAGSDMANDMANKRGNVANTENDVANKEPGMANTYRYRDAESRRAYMREYMKRRRRTKG